MTETNPLEILVAEDTRINSRAAQEAILPGYTLVICQTGDDAWREMTTKLYAGAIFDYNLPWKSGEQPAEHGKRLAEEAGRMRFPYIILTARMHHADEVAADAFYMDEGKMWPLTSTSPKNTPKGWQEAIAFLDRNGTLEQNLRSRQRYFRAFKKMYRQT